jgi:hypothetical protein
MLSSSVASASVVVLGAVHGINPAMGWLFAVSLGLQAGRGRAVWRALIPLALGHALAIAATVAAAALVGVVLPLNWLRWLAAAALLSFGAFHLLRHRHPNFGGICVGDRDLTIWSFLMASAHGAGLMVLPFVLAVRGAQAHHAGPGLSPTFSAGLLATMLHTASYLFMAGALAWIVYRKLGLRLLRTAWINLNLIWAAALVITALITPLL